jgi:hypothetical protein
MFLHLPIAILATFSPIVVSDTVPKFDIVRECRIEGGPSVDQARCSRDEAAALRQLQDAWAQYASEDRKACTAETTTGDFASYVELLTCLEMAREANNTGKNPRDAKRTDAVRTFGPGLTVGVGGQIAGRGSR